jgi:hypothetical protein
MNSDEEMTKTKIVGLNKFYNFVRSSITLFEEMTKTKIIYSPKILFEVLIY